MKESYPYQNSFNIYLQNIKHSSSQTLHNINYCTSVFWNYYIKNLQQGTEIEQVTENNIRDFLDYLYQFRKLKVTTINKYLTCLKSYFTYLYQQHFNSTIPTLAIKGYSFNRQKTVVIGWIDHLKELIQIPELKDNTRKALILIALGFKKEEFLRIKWNQVDSKLDDSFLKEWLKKHLDFTNTSDPTIFSAYAKNKKLHTIRSIQVCLADDQKYLPMESTITALRLGYIYTLVSNVENNDEYLMQRLNFTQKSLAYYKNNVLSYELIPYSKVKSNFKQRQNK